MKERYRAWANLSANYKPPPKATPLRMMEIPSVRTLETKLLLHSNRRRELGPEAEGWCDELCRELFGTDTDGVRFRWPEEYWDLPKFPVGCPERDQIELRAYQYDVAFTTKGEDTGTQASLLKELGLDFYDDKGDPLLCLPRFAEAAEAAARGYRDFGARLPSRDLIPDPDQLNAAAMEHKLKRDAAAFQAARRRRT